MIFKDEITEIFCSIDEFYKVFEPDIQKKLISYGKKQKNKDGRIARSEMLTTIVLFYIRVYQTLKHFNLYYVKEHLRGEFPVTVSYPTDAVQCDALGAVYEDLLHWQVHGDIP